MLKLTFIVLVDQGVSDILALQSISSTGMTVSTFTTSNVIWAPKFSLFRKTLTRSSTSTTHQRTFPALYRISKQSAQQQAVSRQGAIPLLVINRLNNPATNELEARAIIMVDARMARGRSKARGNHKTNVKAKASLVAPADTNRRTDEVVARVVKAND
jgi:hypothetical protein